MRLRLCFGLYKTKDHHSLASGLGRPNFFITGHPSMQYFVNTICRECCVHLFSKRRISLRNIDFFSFILVLVVLTTGFGCACMPKKTSGPVFTTAQAPAGKAVVYLFRTDKFMMSANAIFMSLPKAENNCFGMVTAR